MAHALLDFAPFDDPKFKATRDAWSSDAASGLAFPTDVERLFEWIDTHRAPKEGDATAFGVFNKGKNIALGVCEIVITRQSARSKWVKLVKLHLRPSVDAELQDGNPDNAMNTFTTSISGSMGLQLAHAATTLKVYGRTHEQLTFLKALLHHLKQRDDIPAKASIEGRYLSIVITPTGVLP